MLGRLLALVVPALAIGAAGAQEMTARSPEEKGALIAERMDSRDIGFKDSETVVTMVLENAFGQRSERHLRLATLEVDEAGKGDKSLVVFDRPRAVEGTALLSFTHFLEPDDQWLYLPALKRVKRVSSANKSGPFMGSEFAFEDMLSQEAEKFDHLWLRDGPCPDHAGDLDCHVVERIPRYEDSGYTKQIAWIDRAEYRLQQVVYYDRKGEPLKTMTATDFKLYLDRYWRAHTLRMVNHQTGKKTTLRFDPYEFRVGVRESDFHPNRLKRRR